MATLPVRHFDWQVLRAAKRSKKPLSGHELRVYPSRRSKDGSFLSEMVELGLLKRVTGSAATPFEATYALTERGEHAAEYGECDFPPKPKVVETQPTSQASSLKSKKPARASR